MRTSGQDLKNLRIEAILKLQELNLWVHRLSPSEVARGRVAQIGEIVKMQDVVSKFVESGEANFQQLERIIKCASNITSLGCRLSFEVDNPLYGTLFDLINKAFTLAISDPERMDPPIIVLPEESHSTTTTTQITTSTGTTYHIVVPGETTPDGMQVDAPKPDASSSAISLNDSGQAAQHLLALRSGRINDPAPPKKRIRTAQSIIV